MATALSLKEKNADTVNQAIRELQNGRNNATGSFTLTANATSTTVQAPNCSPTSFVFLSAQTPDAANDAATTSVIAGSGQFVVTHASNPRVDRTFGFVVLGGN
jgi:hypothetical protein